MNIEIVNQLSAEEYNQLRQQVGWGPKNLQAAQAAIQNSTIVKKALCDGVPVGMARAIGDGMSYLLVDVVVSRAFQKKGIGKKLLAAIIEAVRENTLPGEYSTVNLISIAGMENFYERCGFQAVPFGYNGSGMRMKIDREK